MVNAEVIPNQSVVERVSSLPLVTSTYRLVFSVYSSTKDNHPYIRTVCEAAEQGVRTITSVALTTASPIMDKLEPQLTIANDLACKGLDRIEKTLPILRQPSEQVVSSAKGVVTSAKDAVTGRVSGAKDSVSGTLSGVVQKTRGAVQDSVEKTKAVVSGGVNTMLESRVMQLVSSGVDTALSTSENLVEHYLPVTEEEIELEATAVGSDGDKRSYYVRLGCLSTKLRKRAYTRAVARIQHGRQKSMRFISELNSTADLIKLSRTNIDGANKLNSLMPWKARESVQENGHQAEMIESRTLALARSLTQQLQTTCLVIVSSMQGLPNHIQQEALSLTHSAAQVYNSFSKAAALGDLPDTVLASSKVQMSRMKDSLDGIMDYLVNNTPLNWLVGPFYPRLAPSPSRFEASAGRSSPPASPKPALTRPPLEMQPLLQQQPSPPASE
ncbi:perilipin-2 [Oryzias latipes]|uniref:Perilipin n=1 Tax=Oryzias latipes TaxID=8090 RepID=A0A3B3I6T1_ORYLA|nr:perilipin-2 [Oryzias latipes]